MAEALEGTSRLIGFVSTAVNAQSAKCAEVFFPVLLRPLTLHATRRSCDLVRPSSVAIAARLVRCKSTLGYRLATADALCPPEMAFDDRPSEAGSVMASFPVPS